MHRPRQSWLAASTAALFASSAVAQTSTASDVDTLYNARIPFIVQTYPVVDPVTTLNGWIQNQTAQGTWPDVNYLTGCSAQRANWPAQNHWLHTIPLAAAYIDALPHTANFTQQPPNDFIANATVKAVVDKAMDYWFANDFTDPACLDQGGLPNNTCPCNTPGLWNTNWYSNLILIPRQALQTCILMNDTITAAERTSCINMGYRGYSAIDRFIYGLGYITGANTLDVANNGINVGLLEYYAGDTANGTALINDAYSRVHREVQIQTGFKADGIRPDGSFGQHVGVLYNGNYGKDYANLVLSLEISAANTPWQANQTSKDAFSTHIEGSSWMIYRNTLTNVIHWDFSTLGRFISFAVSDKQATAALNINMTQVQQLGQLWGDQTLQDTATAILTNSTSVNVGNVVGNRMFWDNDYMVQRGKNYVSTLKMLSPRSSNTECLNNQNPSGFHMGQGVTLNYQFGNEYEDIQNAWDWNLIPGITTNYNATNLDCNHTQWSGNRTFVGGASDGSVGAAAMDYLNPYSGAFAYKKAWFWFPGDVQHVVVADIVDDTPGYDVYSVLDQKRANGPVYVNGKVAQTGNFTTATSVWHSGIGYTFEGAGGYGGGSGIQHLGVSVATKTGNWSVFGTSAAGVTSSELFSAWLHHDPSSLTSASVSYSVFPDTKTPAAFYQKVRKTKISTISATSSVFAAVDEVNLVLSAVFWDASGGKLKIPTYGYLSTTAGAIVILNGKTGSLVVSDPTQSLTSVSITVSLSRAVKLGGGKCKSLKGTNTYSVTLPSGPLAGKSVVVPLCK